MEAKRHTDREGFGVRIVKKWSHWKT